jgi:hypothetical protein
LTWASAWWSIAIPWNAISLWKWVWFLYCAHIGGVSKIDLATDAVVGTVVATVGGSERVRIAVVWWKIFFQNTNSVWVIDEATFTLDWYINFPAAVRWIWENSTTCFVNVDQQTYSIDPSWIFANWVNDVWLTVRRLFADSTHIYTKTDTWVAKIRL